jgi:hypothetical protein
MLMQYDEPTQGEIRAAQAKAVGGARPKCNIGKSCSAACITKTDMCLVEIPVSAGQSLSKVADMVIGGGDDDKLAFVREYVQDVDEKTKKKLLNAIRNEDKQYYDKMRNEIITLNEKLSKTEEGKQVGPLKVPVTWERLQQVKEAYGKATALIKEDMLKAVREDNIKKYEKLEEKLARLHDKLGSKLGESKAVPMDLWWRMKEDLESPFVGKKFSASPDLPHSGIRKIKEEGSSLRERALAAFGGSIKKLERALINLKEFTSSGYTEIKMVQGLKDKKFPDPFDETAYMRKMGKQIRGKAIFIERLLSALPKPDVEKYRGKLATTETLNKMIADTKAGKGFSFASLTSWSNSPEQAKKFADADTNGDYQHRVFYIASNRRGSPISPLSNIPSENEILTPSNTNYRYRSYRTHTDEYSGDKYHIFEVEEL